MEPLPHFELAECPPVSRARQTRRDLLERVAYFMLRHDLEVTGCNLAAVCNALSGSNGRLAEAVAAREMSGDPIDQRWLDTVARLDPDTGERMNELETLMDQLEYSLMRFSQSARNAHEETSDHRDTLDAQLLAMREGLDPRMQAERGEGDVDRVITLSRAMLERIEQVEISMKRSEAESEQLRENLAKARLEANVDHLTRLPNRRAFERTLISAVQRAQATGRDLCVAFCDVDRFKAVNDRHGHDAGDRVLVSIAATLSMHANNECFVARHGGEEFVLLFYDQDIDDAWRKLDGMRRAQAAKTLIDRKTGKPFGRITFSGGLTQIRSLDDAREALARADAALYEAKNSGRNRIVAG